MKYEYLKGSEKDFEGKHDGIITKYRLIGHVTENYSKMSVNKLISCSLGHMVEIIAERRPITEPVWDGEGMPPVGSNVDVMMYRGCGSDVDLEWGIEKVLGHDGDVIIVASGQRHGDYNGINKDFFRPILSPEDVARDETITSLYNAYMNIEHSDCVAQGIYDAIAAGKIPGITKTPTVSELMRVTENATREDCEAIVKMLSGK